MSNTDPACLCVSLFPAYVELVWDPMSHQQSVCLTDVCHSLKEDYSIFEGEHTKPVKVKPTLTHFSKQNPVVAVVFYYLKRAYYLLGCTFRYIFCIFVSRSGIHRGSGSQAEKLCRWRCLYSPVPQKVSFCLMCLKMDIRISTNKKAGVEYNTCILYPFVPYLIQRIVLSCIK